MIPQNTRLPRWRTFLYQDGLIVSCTVRALDTCGVLTEMTRRESWTLGELSTVTRTRPSYLQVALRCLASQGWLEQTGRAGHLEMSFAWRPEGRDAAPWFPILARGGHYLCREGLHLALPDDGTPRSPLASVALRELVACALEDWAVDGGRPPPALGGQLDGVVLIPAFLALARQGVGGADAGPSARFPAVNGRPFPVPEVQPLLRMQRFLDDRSGHWTDAGLAMADYVPNLGMAASYLPLLSRLPEMMRADGRQPVECVDEGVDRSLNVLASGWAHRKYFEAADAIFRDVFDNGPLEDQPTFVADVGCGDGTWLERIYRTVERTTRRGRHLDRHPLIMIGLDLSPHARRITARRLEAAGIPVVMLPGDVRDPAAIAEQLAQRGLRMGDGLHVRSFLDHDRQYRGSQAVTDHASLSTGAFIDARGELIASEAIEADLVEHLRAWAPYVSRHGLVLLEAHCVAPQVARRHLGELHSIAYDTYHGYSRQYPVEFEVFMRCCQKAGLATVTHQQQRYPSRRPFVAVSLNRLIVPRAGASYVPPPGQGRAESDWEPEPRADLEDGEALHRLLYHEGDVRCPRTWCGLPTGRLVRDVVAELLRKLRALPADAEGRTIRILDYGTGTGHSLIELLKACHVSGVSAELERSRARVHLLASDLPGDWFARGRELLSHSPLVSFHHLTEGDRFRPLLEVTGGRTVDMVVASMVFHLVPPRALERLSAELASVLEPGGALLWSSPDIGPAPDDTLCFHDPSRALRREVLGILEGDLEGLKELVARSDDRHRVAWLPEAIARILDATPHEERARWRTSRTRQMLVEPTSVDTLDAALRPHFDGTTTRGAFELLREDIRDMLLVPSNQRNYFPEVRDPAVRDALLRLVLAGRVLPGCLEGPAGTGAGCSVWWTFGQYRRREVDA